MSGDIVSLLFLALITKHFVCDFLLQWRYQYANKGTYLHPGGILHAGICMLGTLISLVTVVGFELFFVYVILVEGLIHYHIDWAKMNITKYYNLRPDRDESFWYLLGFDQYLHYLTYVGIVVAVV